MGALLHPARLHTIFARCSRLATGAAHVPAPRLIFDSMRAGCRPLLQKFLVVVTAGTTLGSGMWYILIYAMTADPLYL